MKKLFLLIPLVLGVGSSAWASTCTSAALSVYEGSMFSCNIGDLVFSNFTSSGIDTSTTVADITGPESGLDFAVDLTAVGPGNEAASIGYLVTCDGCTMDDWALETGGAGSVGNGGVSVVEFSTPGVLEQFTHGPANLTTGTGSATFSPADSVLSVATSIALGGGTAGTVTTLGSVTNLFSLTSSTSPVPEPSLLILCAGLLGLLPFARRRFAR
jgi:hypothetical protein